MVGVAGSNPKERKLILKMEKTSKMIFFPFLLIECENQTMNIGLWTNLNMLRGDTLILVNLNVV